MGNTNASIHESHIVYLELRPMHRLGADDVTPKRARL